MTTQKMNEMDLKCQQLLQEVAKWKGRAVEAAAKACQNCEEYQEDKKRDRKNCGHCRVLQIQHEAAEIQPGSARKNDDPGGRS